VSCYLCAYKRSEKPRTLQSLPSGSPAGQNDELGTCAICSVWACSIHGTLYGVFECAICTPARSVKEATVAGSAGNASAAMAYLVGLGASPIVRARMGRALELVVGAGRQQSDRQEDNRLLVVPGAEEPNLVTNLAEVIRGPASGPRAFVPAVRATSWAAGSMVDEARLEEAQPTGAVPSGAISIDAVGGSVREAFRGSRFLEPIREAETIATGSMLLAYSLAEETIATQRGEQPSDWPGLVDEFRAPWQVSHPVLLDPVMWMMGTAYVLASR
jgi:hypothetical protein